MEKDFFRAGEFYSLRIMVWPVSIYLVEDGPTKMQKLFCICVQMLKGERRNEAIR